MRLRIEPDHLKVANHLMNVRYPARHLWTRPELAKGLAVRFEEDDGRVIGYVWGVFLQDGRTLSVHAVWPKRRRHAWFEPGVVDRLIDLATMLGAEKLEVRPLGGDRLKALLKHVLLKLGFEADASFATFTKDITNHGLLGPQATSGPNTAPAAPAAGTSEDGPRGGEEGGARPPTQRQSGGSPGPRGPGQRSQAGNRGR
jgi:hypothetical protein